LGRLKRLIAKLLLAGDGLIINFCLVMFRWGGKLNRGSMDPVHGFGHGPGPYFDGPGPWTDRVHGWGPWTRGSCFVLSPSPVDIYKA